MSKKRRGSHHSPAPASHPQNQLQMSRSVTAYQGPIPSPSMLREYDTILPGAADRIIAMAEAQSRHRQELESKAIASDIANSRTGLHYGLTIGLAAIIGGCLCIALGYQVGGSIIGGTGLTSLVGVFVYGSASRRKERERRLSMLAKGEAG
jgi:uncharacterized membrane protein